MSWATANEALTGEQSSGAPICFDVFALRILAERANLDVRRSDGVRRPG